MLKAEGNIMFEPSDMMLTGRMLSQSGILFTYFSKCVSI